MKKVQSSIVILVLSMLLTTSLPGIASADFDARDYIAAPPGTDLIMWYYHNTSGNQAYSQGDKVSNELNVKANIGIFRYIHYFGTGPFTTYINVIEPFGSVSLDGRDAGGVETSSSGLGDVIMAPGIFFINKPASKTYLGFTEYVSAPTGVYNHEKAVNLGSNRWAFKSELVFSQGFGPGFVLDIGAAAEFFTDNTDYSQAGLTQKKDPLYTLEAHLSKDLTKNLYGAVEYFYHIGGETEVGGISNQDKVENHQMQLTLGYNFTQNYQLLVQYKAGLYEYNGVKGDSFGLRFLYAF